MRIESPSKFYPGYVVIPDQFTYPQALAWEESTLRAEEFEIPIANNDPEQESKLYRVVRITKPISRNYAFIPGILACVSEWHIEKFPAPLTLENFPSSPARAILTLTDAIIKGIRAILYAEDEEKNA